MNSRHRLWRRTLGYCEEIWKALNLKHIHQKLKVPEIMLHQNLGKGLYIYWKILLLYIVSTVNKVYVNRKLNNVGSWSLLLAPPPKGFILPVKRNCIRCNLVYPVLLPSASAFLSIRVACLMICGPFKATILWSVGRCDHKSLCKADQVCPWAAVGCTETHTNTHTHTHTRDVGKAQQRDVRMYNSHLTVRSHIFTELWVFPTGCSRPSEACAELWSKPNVFLNRGYGC